MDWDCIVVGGGAAGLSAALMLGRARRRTLVVDAGRQSNRAAHGIGGLLGQDGRPPSELYADGRAELAKYPSMEVRDGEVATAERSGDGFVLDGETTSKVLLAPGMDYAFPDVPGLAERWGGTVFHCPFCHGWEVRERPLAVLDQGETAVHRALLLRAWSDDVVLLPGGPGRLAEGDAAKVRAAGVTIDERPVARVRGEGAGLDAVVFEDGDERACGGLLVGVTLRQRSDLAAQLGVETVENPLARDAIAVEAMGTTSVPGVSAAGDAAVGMPSVANAIAAGAAAAARIVGELVA